MRCLKWMGGNRADAEDALANAALSAFRKFPPGGELESPAAWLSQVVRNACIDLLRTRKREWSLRAEPQDDSAPSALECQRDPAPGPEDHYLQRETLERLGHALEALPAHLREPLLQRVGDGLSYAQLAGQSASSEVSLRKRVQEARRLLRRSL